MSSAKAGEKRTFGNPTEMLPHTRTRESKTGAARKAAPTEELHTKTVLSPAPVLLDVAVSFEALQDPVDGTLDITRPQRQILKTEPIGLISQDLSDTYDLPHQRNVVIVRHVPALRTNSECQNKALPAPASSEKGKHKYPGSYMGGNRPDVSTTAAWVGLDEMDQRASAKRAHSRRRVPPR